MSKESQEQARLKGGMHVKILDTNPGRCSDVWSGKGRQDRLYHYFPPIGRILFRYNAFQLPYALKTSQERGFDAIVVCTVYHYQVHVLGHVIG